MRRTLGNERGSVLIVVYMILAVLLVMSSLFVSRTVTERKLFDIGRERTEAFYLAEAGVDRGIAELNDSSNAYTGTLSPIALGRGEYSVTVTSMAGSLRKIDAHGYVPSLASPRAMRHIEAVTKKQTPPNFYDNAIYAADDITLNGNSYIVNGDVIYADTISDTTHVTGTNTQDPSVSPLAQFDFAVLRAIAVIQGNLYDAARLANVQNHSDSYPSDFWYSPPTDPADPTTGIPNVVYVEGDMVMNGNIGTIGGFFLVVGDVLTDPTDTSDTTINGNGQVDGCIYTTGNFRINGGGGNLNIDGGVWSGSEARMNGNATVSYNGGFMDAIEYLINSNSAGSVVQILSWREVL